MNKPLSFAQGFALVLLFLKFSFHPELTWFAVISPFLVSFVWDCVDLIVKKKGWLERLEWWFQTRIINRRIHQAAKKARQANPGKATDKLRNPRG